ncbi:hypothetical protein IW262DRAFT_1372540 [Armillaria fumosa]|nr:hypothetical protein IW262DRAFT_1372540 [Armillaria fumosa]
MATTAEEVTLSAALLPVDPTTTKKKKKKPKKKSAAATTATDFIPQQQLGATAETSSDTAQRPLFIFSQAVKEFNDAQEAGEDSKEALTRFWRHAYRLGEEDGHFEASREMEQASYQQGYDAAIAKLTAAGNRLDGDGTVGRRAQVDVGISASMQEDTEADDAFERGREAGYHDGLEEGQLEAGKGALELFIEGCSGGRKDGAAKEKERWIVAGHVESGICRAGRKDVVDVATMVRAPSRSFAHIGVTTDLPGNSEATSPIKSAPFSWADDVESIPVHFIQSTCTSLGPRDISCLSSGAQKPFASLQHRSKRNSIRQRRSTGHNHSRYQVPVQQHFTRQSSRLSAPFRQVNTFMTQPSSLDWTSDPRLFRLRDALEDLGWCRAR